MTSLERRLGSLVRTGLAVSVLLVPWVIAPSTVDAQSVFAIGGLGAPMEGLDARARALGNLGIGLTGFSLYRSDPAAAAGLPAPVLQATMQPTWGDYINRAGETQELRSTRFPHLAFSYPVASTGTLSLTYGGVLDQRWKAIEERELTLAGTPVRVTDEFVSDGGTSVVTLGWAQRIGSRFAAGVNLGYYTGKQRRELTRTVSAEDLGFQLDPTVVFGEWKTGGFTGTVGMLWDPLEILRVAGSVEWGGTVKIEPIGGTVIGEDEVELPLRFRLGTSASLTPQLSLVGSLSVADWSDVGSGLSAELQQGTDLGYGLGLEFTGASLLGRALPLRAGYRRSEFPFQFEGVDPDESVWTGGFGYVFAASDSYPLASIESAIERGSRTAGAVKEEFWRATFTLRLSGG
jgi:hypothetical protein